MKKIFSYLLLVVSFSIILTSCKKYPDGPAFSLLSRKARLANTWHIGSYSENGVDKTTDFKNAYQSAKIVIDKEGNYSIYYKAFGLVDYNESGTWKFSNNDDDFTTTPTSGSGSAGTHHILKLKDKELWYKEDPDGSNIVREYHLIP